MAYTAWMLASGGSMAIAQNAGFSGICAVLIPVVTIAVWWWMQRHFTSQLKERGQW
jgi:hypothetical protein